MISTKRLECFIDSDIYDYVMNYTQKKIEFFPYYKKTIYNKKNKEIGLLIITGSRNMCILSLTIGDKHKSFVITNITELCGIYSLTYNGILYLIKIDKSTKFNKDSAFRQFYYYNLKVKNTDIDSVINLTKYINLTNEFNMGILLYCLIISMKKIKEDLDLIKYIEEKFQYYGHDIYDIDTNYKIDFKEKLNTKFSLEGELEKNSKSYLKMFYELFKYLLKLKTIDTKKYQRNNLYNNLEIYFSIFIQLLSNEGIISIN